MPFLHLSPVELEMFRRAAAGMMIPAVREQDATDIEEQGRDGNGVCHETDVLPDMGVGFVIA